MTDLPTARKIGFIQAIKAITAGLVIAYLIMAFLAGPLWLFEFDYAPAIMFAVGIIYAAGYFFGRLTGIWVSKHSRHSAILGIVSGFLIVWTATFFGSLIGFIKEGLVNQNSVGDAVRDYIIKPMSLVTLFGFFPIVLVGTWYGLSIQKKSHSNLKQ